VVTVDGARANNFGESALSLAVDTEVFACWTTVDDICAITVLMLPSTEAELAGAVPALIAALILDTKLGYLAVARIAASS
jgi:hypothetical protein